MKKPSGIYEHLKQKGLLNSSDKDAIEQARKEYMHEYKKSYKKQRLQNGKEYKIYFDNKVVRSIQRKAKENNIPETTAIRELVLEALDKHTPNTEVLSRILHIVKIIYHNQEQKNKIEELYNKIMDDLLKLRTL